MAKQGIGQFALIPSLKKSASLSIQALPTHPIIPNLPQIETEPAVTNKQPEQPPQRANCTAVEIYAGQCSQL